MELQKTLEQDIALIEPALQRYLSGETNEGYDQIFDAAKYAALAGGKRLRPVILLEFCRLCGGDKQQALPFACALEMIHTYSLIHDDLPCMDDDDLRRGRPTCHKVYGEATAVLAGDGLLTRAFETMSAADCAPETALAAIRYMSGAAGMNGMIGGQVLDIASEGEQVSLETLERLQKLKTGCLLCSAAAVGCIIAGKGDAQTLSAAEEFGNKLGLAFQIEDDLLDIEGDAAVLGKTVGKDQKSEKSTFPALLGMEKCRELVRSLTDQAVAALSYFGGDPILEALARSLVGRSK